jgi:hypothetical protein
MSDMLFYEQVASLNAAKHGQMKLKPLTDYGFAAKTNSVPIVGGEFGEVAKEYPIAFVKSADDSFLPVALLGLRDNENLFVDATGAWNARYIPAFVRRYPFVPAELNQERTVVCIDEQAKCLQTHEGEALFVEGKPGLLIQNVLNLLQDYQRQARRMAETTKQLVALDLLVERNAQIALNQGDNFNLNGIHVVDEARLLALASEPAMKLLTAGELGLIYAHLFSLSNLNRLMEHLAQRLNSTTDE